MTTMRKFRITLRRIKHFMDWLLARVIVGVAGMAIVAAAIFTPIALAELLCRAFGLV